MRTVAVAADSEGINLLRSKGGVSPKALFDLTNGWVTSKKTINARPGSVPQFTAPAGTVGGVGFENKIHTFAAVPTASSDPGVVVDVLRHPTGGAAALAKIHYATPYLGRLYVVAEFTDGVINHYWVETPAAWKAATTYPVGSVVQPSTATGFFYENETSDAALAWQASTVVVLADQRQPTTVNGFRYVVSASTGVAPLKTSSVEPTWPVVNGGTVIERHFYTEYAPTPPGTTTPKGTGPGGDTGGTGPSEYAPYPVLVR